MCRASESPFDQAEAALQAGSAWLAGQPDQDMRAVIIQCRQIANRAEALSAEATRRFEKARGYEADGAVGIVPWMREFGKMSGGQAAERVEVARQLEQLPRTEEALARGQIGYEHAVAMARTAAHVGVAEVRKAEVNLLKHAETMDPGQFVGVAKHFEHQVDRDAALAEANRAHERRYFHIGAPVDALVRLDGQVTTEQGAIIRTALEPHVKPSKNDARTAGQRSADALTDLCRSVGSSGCSASDTKHGHGAAPRTLLIIKAGVDTLAKTTGAPAGELEWVGTVPAETVRRIACDTAITRITGLGELEWETTHASRTIPPSMRRVLVARDQHCVFPGCDRPPAWCDGHHLMHWADGGPTKIENLALLCKHHHRRVHEEGWTVERKGGRWVAVPPVRVIGAAGVLRQ